MNQKSSFNGSLWVTFHSGRKIKGSQSIMSTCTKKCQYCSFCYSEHLQSFMHSSRRAAEYNEFALRQDNFISPRFNSEVVRWFSFGSCNGNVKTLENIKQATNDNPQCHHGIWIEPHYWRQAKDILKDTRARLVYSNKVINTTARIEGHVSFNLADTSEHLEYMLSVDPDAKLCQSNCSDCGWYCYKHEGTGIVIEKVRR